LPSRKFKKNSRRATKKKSSLACAPTSKPTLRKSREARQPPPVLFVSLMGDNLASRATTASVPRFGVAWHVARPKTKIGSERHPASYFFFSVSCASRPVAERLRQTALVQCPHFFAAAGIGIAHCGQSFVLAGGGGGFGIHRFTERTSRNTANATIRKLIIVLMKLP